MRRVFAWICLVPAIYTVAFFAYAGLSNDPGCGSQAPWACFAAGMVMLLLGPLALFLTPLSIFLFLKRLRAERKG